VDTFEDFLVIENLIHNLGIEKPWIDYVNYLISHPEVMQINDKFKRNEGYQKSIKNE
jgi:hypothetical protein